MKKRFYSLTVLMAVMMILGMTGISGITTAQAAEPIIIKIGNISPLSGPAGPWGQTPILGYEAFIELMNKKGIVVGGKTYKFQLINVDDQGSPEGGAAAAKRLIYEEKVKFIVGHWSWNFPAVAAVTNPAKVILISRTGNEAVPGGAYSPEKMPYTVFGTPSHEQFISDIKAIVAVYPKYKKIGINDSTLGKGIGWDYVDRELNKTGIRFHHEWYPPGTQDFTPFITRYKEAGCDIIYGAGDVTAAMLVAKQRWEMGYKDWKTGTSGMMLDPMMYIGVSGMDASQGFMSSYGAIWNFKKTKINPKYIKMCQEVQKIVAKKIGKPYNYTGWTAWVPTHLTILAQAMEKAGTVEDTDAIMKAIRGGTFDTPIGKYTMSGAETYGSPVVFGTAGAMSKIKGDKEVYLSESPWKPLP
jgi:branched-chain amino acid transport system substrate-binding protein